MIKIKRVGSKLGASLFSLVFVVGFGLGGWFGGIFPMAQQLHGWWRAGDLVAVQARIDKLELREIRAEDGPVYSVDAEFVYQYDGKTYRSKRISIGGDNSDGYNGYNRKTHASLLQARSNDQSVTLWMDPQQPAFAVYDRQTHLNAIIFLIPFATLFPAISLGALWALWAIWFRPDEEDTAGDFKGNGQLASQAYSGQLELAAEKSGAGPMTLFAVIWNLICMPVAATVYMQKNADGILTAFITVFVMVGVVMIWAAFRMRFLRRRIGEPVLSLAQQPYAGIEDMLLRLRFEPALGLRMTNARTLYPVQAEVLCEHVDSRGDDSTTKTLWSKELGTKQVVHGAPGVDFKISLPADMPASGTQDHKDVEVIWKLKLKALDAELIFKLPVRQGVGGQVNASDVLARQYPRESAKLFGLPILPGDTSKQTRSWFWAYGIFFILITIAAFVIFSSAGDSRSRRRSSNNQHTEAQTETLKQLQARLNAGGDVNARDAEGRSLLMHAADDNDIAKVRYLLQKGAQVDLVTPRDADGNGERSALFAAIANDSVEIVQLLADADADLRRPSNKVWTPAHYAAYKGALKSLRYLHERGVAMDQAFDGGRGSTPLMIATQYNQLAVISFLQLAGADRSKKDLYGEDACGYARYFNQAQAAAALGCP
ncbi:ankyrin repeat domain-containing protein [Undibacterium sp. TC4M20W]|uniref:ankyrin repeat domain-containing protein n=1 Tax=Undibacterium sp. TC4M20W TaxID=3413052 RepID=UPI003BF176CA